MNAKKQYDMITLLVTKGSFFVGGVKQKTALTAASSNIPHSLAGSEKRSRPCGFSAVREDYWKEPSPMFTQGLLSQEGPGRGSWVEGEVK